MAVHFLTFIYSLLFGQAGERAAQPSALLPKSAWDFSGELIAAALPSSPRGTQTEDTEGAKQESAGARRKPAVFVQLA